MAISNTTEVAALIDRSFDPVFAELISRDQSLFKRFPHSKGEADGVRWKVMRDIKNTSAAAYAEGAALVPAVTHTYIDAKLDWKYAWVTVEVTGQAQAQAQARRSFEGVNDILANETRQSVLDLKNKLNDMLLDTSVDANAMDGIFEGIKDTVIYATIDPASVTEWAGYRNHNSGVPRALSVALMQTVKTTVEDTPRFGNVSVILTGPTQWNNYGNLLTSLRRFTPSQTLDGGFLALDFEGVPVVKVPGYPTGRMEFLTEKDKQGNEVIRYRVLQNFKTLDKSQSTGDAMKFVITHYSQLQNRNRRIHGSLVDLS